MNWGEETKKLVCDLYKSGLCIREVSIKLGVPYRTVHKYLIDNGIQRRTRWSYPHKEWSEERRKKYSEMAKGRTLSHEARMKISEANRCDYNGLNGYGHTKPSPKGYVLAYCPCHPHAHKDGYVFLHTIIVEMELGRYLESDEVVHHINHIRDDNRPENLMLMNRKEHMSMHMKERHEQRRKEKCNLCQ